MIGFLVRGRVRIKNRNRVRVRVGVTFNVRLYRWSNCRRSKCRTFPNMINFDALDFSERRSEEVRSFF